MLCSAVIYDLTPLTELHGAHIGPALFPARFFSRSRFSRTWAIRGGCA